MQTIIKFKYNNKWYYVSKDNDRILYYVLKDNNKIFDLSEEDEELFNFVINYITPSNKRIFLFNYLHNGINYNIFLDPKTKLKMFNPQPSEDSLIFLNNVFNNQSEVLYLEIYNESENTFIKRLAKYKNIQIAILLSASLSLEFIAVDLHITKKILDAERIEAKAIVEMKVDYTDEQVKNIILESLSNNSFLDENERNIIISNIYVFIDNKDYIDFEYIKKRLSTLKIKYISEALVEGNYSISGQYDSSENLITFYNANKLEDVTNSTITHELYHVLTKHNYNDYNSFLIETINTIFNEEYSNCKEQSTYTSYYNYTKMLMEVIGSEPFKKYHSYSDTSFIIDELIKLYDNEDEAYKLIHNLENYKCIVKSVNALNMEEKLEELNKLNNIIIEEIGLYYEAKYNRKMNEDLIMLSYYDENSFINKIRQTYNIDDDYLIIYSNYKRYFYNTENNEIEIKFVKKESPVVVIHDEEGRTFYKPQNTNSYSENIIVINDENRYISNGLTHL